MPLFRGVAVTVHTPFAIDGLPESPLPTPDKITAPAEDKNKYASVLIPGHAQSLFWLSYSIEAPSDETFFVFKLFINRQYVVTWCCDEDQGWKGKVQFALFKKEGSDVHGGAGMEKRVLQFGEIGPDQEEDRCVEVRVYRAGTRVRVPRQLEDGGEFTEGKGIQLPQAGKTKRAHPRKFYTFGLLDPKDDPYATFRFYYRTQGKLDEITYLDRRTSHIDESIILVDPGRKTVVKQIPTGKLIKTKGNRVSRLPKAIQRTTSGQAASTPPPHTPCTPPISTCPAPSIPRSPGQVNLRRLSIPPSTILRPLLEQGPLPASPVKQRDHAIDSEIGQYSTRARKENVGGIFRSLLQGAMMRKRVANAAVTEPRSPGVGGASRYNPI